MSDREVEKEWQAIKRDTQIRPLAIVGPRFRDRLQRCLPKEGDEELQKSGMP